MGFRAKVFWVCTVVFFLSTLVFSRLRAEESVYTLDNGILKCEITVKDGHLAGDTYVLNRAWARLQGGSNVRFATSGDFALDFMWTDWRPPGKVNNAENPAILTSRDFVFLHATRGIRGKAKTLTLAFEGPGHLQLRVVYVLEPGAFYCRRQISVSDSAFGRHFLRWIWPLTGTLPDGIDLVRSGGFGQPIAFACSGGGVFLGLEFPTAQNEVSGRRFRCGQEIGERVGRLGVSSETVVVGLAPDKRVRLWFDRYLDAIRVAPLKPYLLYNSWYDLRAPVMVRDPSRALTQENVLRTIATLRKRLVEKRSVHFDAFVLDDGWDVYRSDWEVNRDQFPDGFAPLVEALGQMGTHLGLWIGPIGGYSHREWRVTWMREHGYETVGDRMCVAGRRYSRLLLKRVSDFVRRDSIRYFKWDGIQFSCSEPDHGHLPGIYSRRAVMQQVIEMCRTVRVINPSVFTNITTGTWLSPWWLRYTNTIWMQGRDYGYAQVPSISRRDLAMTYRDLVLYRDFVKQNQWFPIASLMTHGIIKGHLNMLGGREEPLDKFTDNAVLYVARGPAMWELYISPDLLTEGELDALAGAIHWAKDRFGILAYTRMVGGDPGEGKPYAYLHFRGKHGIIAARNPVVDPQSLTVRLSSDYGLEFGADSLVLERIYPTGLVASRLYREGDTVRLDLDGFELGLYEIYPISEARKPLLAGAEFHALQVQPTSVRYLVYRIGKRLKVLNPHTVGSIWVDGKAVSSAALQTLTRRVGPVASRYAVRVASGRNEAKVVAELSVDKSWQSGEVAILVVPDEKHAGKADPGVSLKLDGKHTEPRTEEAGGYWRWLSVAVTSGRHELEVRLRPAEKGSRWSGRVEAWLIGFQKVRPLNVELASKSANWKTRPLPPRPWPADTHKVSVMLGKGHVSIGRK